MQRVMPHPKAVRIRNRFAVTRRCSCLVAVLFGGQGLPLLADPVDDVLHPLWEDGAMVRETVQFVQEEPGAPKTAKLTFVPSEVLSVQSAAWPTNTRPHVFTWGTDVMQVKGSALLIAATNAAVPVRMRTTFHPAKGWGFVIDPRRPLDLKTDTGVKLAASANLDQLGQVEVTYRHRGDAWAGAKPATAIRQLPQTMKKLQEKQPVEILLMGDSISEGLGSSAKSGIAPLQPCYGTLLVEALKRHYGYREITLHNEAHSGWFCGDGVNQIVLGKDRKVMTPDTDLVIAAFGMNDAGNGVNKDGKDWVGIYKTNLTIIINGLRKINPRVEIILVSPMPGNPEWKQTILPFFTCVSQHPDFSSTQQVVRELAGTHEGVAAADVTAVWLEILGRKGWHYQDLLDGKPLLGWYDLAANGLNHPNDFGHVLYAQVLTGLLTNRN